MFVAKANFDPIESIQNIERDYGSQVTKEVVEIFVSDYPTKIKNLKTAITRGEMDQTVFLAHNIRSGCLSMGLDPMTKICETIEHKGVHLPVDQLFHLSHELENKFHEISREFKAYFSI